MTEAQEPALISLARRAGECLQQKGLALATVESCTGGWIAQSLTAVAGSSDWFERGYVTYSNRAKAEMAGVAPALIERYGAVSDPVARAMAEGGLAASRAHCCVAVTGIAGPGGGSREKPVGTVYIAWAGRERQTRARHYRFNGTRQVVRQQCVTEALTGLLDFLQGASISELAPRKG